MSLTVDDIFNCVVKVIASASWKEHCNWVSVILYCLLFPVVYGIDMIEACKTSLTENPLWSNSILNSSRFFGTKHQNS